MTILLRGAVWYLKRRVPRRFAGIDPRPLVWISLQTDGRREAERKAISAWDQMLRGWEAMLAGNSTDAEARYKAAQDVAKSRGFRFLPVERVAALPMPDLIERLEAALTPQGTVNPHLVEGILGTAQTPRMTLSKALDVYWQLAADKTRGKSKDQIRRWKNPRMKAFRNLIDLIGDVAMDEIAADDMLEFRDWWWRKINDEDLTPNSANKDFTHMTSTLRMVNQMKRLGLILSLDGLAFAEGEKGTRAPFSEMWIRDKILAPGALGGLNTEARCIVLGMINTGYPRVARTLRSRDLCGDALVW